MINKKSSSIIFGIILFSIFTLTNFRSVLGGAIARNTAAIEATTSSAFTYQGTLNDGATPANGAYDFEFALYDSGAGSTQVGSTLVLNNVAVENGFFTVSLDFGQVAFDGGARWLDISVRPSGSVSFVGMGRQELTAVPYALSLRPGAIISDSLANDSILEVVNTYSDGTVGTAISARASADTSPAIAAYHEGIGHALYGSSNSIYPSVGGSNAGSGRGIHGYSEDGIGVYGFTNNGNLDTGSYGVVGLQSDYTISDQPPFYYQSGGFFAGDNGVIGMTKTSFGYGVFGYSAETTDNGYAGAFVSENANGVFISSPNGTTGLTVMGGTKNAIVETSQGDRQLYSEEATEVLFTDYGFGQLNNGAAAITIDPLYAETVNLNEPYHVFVQVYGNAEVYVDNRTPTGFDVVLSEGDDDVEFSYRIVATRLGYEDARLEPAPWENGGARPDGATVRQGVTE